MYKRALILITLIVFLVGLIFVFCPISFLNAQQQPAGPGDQTPVTGGLPNPLKSEEFEDLIKGISNFLYYIGIPLGVIMILYSAFLFMTSGGSEEKVKKAKKTLLWTIVGLTIIIIGAGFITLIKDILKGV